MPHPAQPKQPQQVTRIPPFRPGMWVKLKDDFGADHPLSLAGQVRQVRSLTCSISHPEQECAVWRVHFGDGRCVEWHLVEREATANEIARAQQGHMTPNGRRQRA